MEKKERVQIFIDGGNFHHLVLKKLNIKELDFSFEKFIDFLVGDREITEFGKRFYIGTVREKKGDEYSREAMSKQTALLNTLEAESWQIKTSKLRNRLEKIISLTNIDCYAIIWLLKIGHLQTRLDLINYQVCLKIGKFSN